MDWKGQVSFDILIRLKWKDYKRKESHFVLFLFSTTSFAVAQIAN